MTEDRRAVYVAALEALASATVRYAQVRKNVASRTHLHQLAETWKEIERAQERVRATKANLDREA